MQSCAHIRPEFALQLRQTLLQLTAVKPIFYGDYLLMRLGISSTSPVTLHRVVHGVFMQKAQNQQATCTTLEHHHTPQQDVQ
eukprot:4233313-Pleurochrysis_carterae.AAC.1